MKRVLQPLYSLPQRQRKRLLFLHFSTINASPSNQPKSCDCDSNNGPTLKSNDHPCPTCLSPNESPCWSCGNCNKNVNLFCRRCSYIQPIDHSIDYFELLKLPVNEFNVNLSQLEENYKSMQKLVHPDKFDSKSKVEKEYSTKNSSILNIAYRILKNPLSRSQYILTKYHNVDAWTEKPTDSEKPQRVPQSLLLEIMEYREMVDYPSTPLDEIKQLQGVIRNIVKDRLVSLASHFREQKLDQAVETTFALQYYTKLESAIEERLQQPS
jgi:molecular chaperone HscB